jgi:anthranilate synthase component 1
VGYFAYDVVRHIERLPDAPPRAVAAPDAVWAFTDVVVVVDNLRAQARVVAGVPVAAADAGDRGGCARCTTRARARGRRGRPPARAAAARAARPRPRRRRRPGRVEHHARALRGRRRARQGVRARRRRLPGAARAAHPRAHDFDGALLYRALRALNPSPYMLHLALDGVELVGSSPELHVRVTDGADGQPRR